MHLSDTSVISNKILIAKGYAFERLCDASGHVGHRQGSLWHSPFSLRFLLGKGKGKGVQGGWMDVAIYAMGTIYSWLSTSWIILLFTLNYLRTQGLVINVKKDTFSLSILLLFSCKESLQMIIWPRNDLKWVNTCQLAVLH